MENDHENRNLPIQKREREKERERDRQTDRQRDRVGTFIFPQQLLSILTLNDCF